jgi:hypothetical protein
MTALGVFSMYLLQVDFHDFQFKQNATAQKESLIFLGVIAAVIVLIVLLNGMKKKSPGSATGSGFSRGGGGVSALFSGISMHRIARDIGLDREQIKMLDFVFKTDDVLDPEKSITTPVLLDRHFRRAYRVIQQSSDSEEEIQSRLSLLFSTRNILENTTFGGLTSTHQLKDDMTISINNGKEKLNLGVVSAGSEHIAVECPRTAIGTLIKFPRGTKLTPMLFTKSNKGFSFETRVIGYAPTYGQNTLLLAHSNQLKFLSQRRFRRRQMVIACKIFFVYVEGSGKKQRLIVDKRGLTGNIADISVGGCSIKTKSSIQVGTKLKIEFTQGDSNVAALGQVLRTNRTGMVTVLHIKFLRVSRKSMNTINAFVYEYAHE